MPARPASSQAVFVWAWALDDSSRPFACSPLPFLVGGEPMDGRPALVPASPSIEATTAKQKHDDDNEYP
jgi:hypothetical protein